MSKDGFQLTNAAALVYEEQKVPAMFGPLAHATLAAHQVTADDVVLDVACGTGIVTRTIRDLFGDQPELTAIDLNEGMIDTARDVSAAEGVVADFRICDATATPFSDGQFSFIICQQGLQYFPDEDAALAEFRRVAVVGARIVITVWSRASPLIVALADSLRTHLGAGLAEQSLAPFSWTGAETIAARMSEAGYSEVKIEELEVNRVLDNPELSIPKEIMSTAVGPKVAEEGDDVLDRVAAEMLHATERYRTGNQLVIPQYTYLISAIAG